jgi:hypothetical protein
MAPSGMMEFWNDGMMGIGIMQCRFNDENHLNDIFKKQYSSIPVFQYSILLVSTEILEN